MLRHGRTAWNADGRFQGHTDVPLDETGRIQAAGLGTLLADLRVDRAVSSDLARARETAEIALAGRGIAIETDADWREMRFGAWEGLAWPEIVRRYPEVDAGNHKAPKFYTPEGGETFDDVSARIGRAVDRIASTASDGERVVVATHAGALHALLRVAIGESEAAALRVKFDPGSLTRIAFDSRGGSIIDINRSPNSSQTAAGRDGASG